MEHGSHPAAPGGYGRGIKCKIKTEMTMTNEKVSLPVPRKRLLGLMDSLSQNHMVYVCAPAGYGKTITARLWLRHKGLPHAHMALDEYDNDLTVFCANLCSAISACQPDNGRISEYARHPFFGDAPCEYTMRAIRALEALPACLAIDDLHVVSSPAVLTFLSAALKKLPESFSLLLLSRSQPPSAFSEFVSKDIFAYIGSGELAFSASEITQLFNSRGISITEEQAMATFTATSGWALGVNALLCPACSPAWKAF
jgi:LuxR family maltose regulon positive regulatory protein